MMNRPVLYYTGMKLWLHRNKLKPFLSDLSDVFSHIQQSDKVYIGWGYKKSGLRAKRFASWRQAHYCLLEDGFLRSLGLGVDGYAPLSLVIDDLGVYYDANKPSRLEKIIQDKELLKSKLADGKRAWDLMLEYKLSKYNHATDPLPSHLKFEADKQHVLLIDQTAGDMALKYGGVNGQTFQEMAAAACRENPDAVIWIKIHPDVLSGKKQGHLQHILQDNQVRVISENINPLVLISKMDKVYTATSQMGFEALLLNKKVITFGLPWYACWGATEDRHHESAHLKVNRRGHASVLELFTAAYLLYARYLSPYTQEQGSIFDVIRYLAMKKYQAEYLQGTIVCIGLSWWKRKIIQPFLQTHHNQLLFFKNLSCLQKTSLPNKTRLLLWGRKDSMSEQWAEAQGMAILRMEDGFIRSIGLGSNLVPPLSLIIDDMGIYFDATKPSRLEWILQNHVFTAEELLQAQELKKALINNQIGKYNVGHGSFNLPNPRPQKVILIPGQVEDDASITFGTNEIKTNLALIQNIKKNNPDAYLIYKPHPDIESGNRVGQVYKEDALQYVNMIVDQADILQCIGQVDEVHTMTSLAGFEALLRNKKVVCYGAPFYSSWGLTEDKYQLKRRNRMLSLDELIVGAMLLYPTYINTKKGLSIDALQALNILVSQKQQKQKNIHSNYILRKYNQLKAIVGIVKSRRFK